MNWPRQLTDEDLKRVHFIGLHPRRWEELKMLLPEKVPEGRRLPLFFGLLDGVKVVEDAHFPEDKVGLFDRGMVLIGFLPLGANHGEGKEGVILGGDGGKRSRAGAAAD